MRIGVSQRRPRRGDNAQMRKLTLATLQTTFDLAQRMRLARVVRIAESTLVRVPTVVGYLRPMILLPASVPYMFTGLRIGVGLSWLAIVAAEMLVGGVGIGFFIWDAWNSSLLSEIILALIYVGIIGFLLDRVIGFAGRLIAGRPI